MRTVSVFCLVVVSGCFGVRGSGVEVEETRDVGAFDAVENRMNIPVTVVDGDVLEVRVTCDDNLIDLVETEVSGGELRIDTPPATAIDPKADCGVDLVMPKLTGVSSSGSGELVAAGTFPDLREVSSSGSGRVRVDGSLSGLQSVHSSGSGGVSVDGISANDVSAESSGSGNVALSGEGGFADLSSTGSGGIDAAGLQVVEADVRNSASGEVSLTVTEYVTVRLSGSGNVRILGGARVDTDDTGSGNVVLD